MTGQGTQPSLLEPAQAPAGASPEPAWAAIAQVIIDSPLPHLDRLFDYGIPADLAEHARVGSRVRVRFAGRNVEGYILNLTGASSHRGIQPIRRVVGEHPVITPEVLDLCTALARRYAGGVADVLRLAIPPRHAAAEKAVLGGPPPPRLAGPQPVDDAPWRPYAAGKAYLRRLAAGEAPRAVWSALPTPAADRAQEWAQALRAATQATLASGRGVLIVAPTAHDLATIRGALTRAGVDHLELTADLGPSARYEAFLHALLGHHRVVIGTRAAAYAPVPDLGLVVCWDEVHDAHAEPRAPYPHVRETLALRATLSGSAALFAGFARSPQAQNFVSTGWAHHLGAGRSAVRARTPRVSVPDEFDREREGAVGHARIPGFAWRRIRGALESGPVLLQVPRAGFTPALSCTTCRRTARCTHCHGPLAATASKTPTCTWCAKPALGWVCLHCEGTAWRARSIGAQRTAEELGRAFPGVPVRVSGRASGRLDDVGPEPALIVATPGAEPGATGGYSLTVLLDGAALTDLPLLTAPIAALHRWLRAAALTSGEVILLGDPLLAPAQAAVRWDPAGYAHRELGEWTDLGFPPSHTVVTITGERADVAALQRHLPDIEGLAALGPVPVTGEVDAPEEGELSIPVRTGTVRLLLRVAARDHLLLTDAVRAAVRIRSAKREGLPVKVKVNPTHEL